RLAMRLVFARFRLRPGQGAHRAGGAHGPRAAGDDARFGARPGVRDAWGEARLDGAARIPAAPCGAAPAPLRACLQLRRDAGAGAAGQGGNPAGRHLRPAARAAGERVTGRADDLVRAVEAALFAAEEPMTADALSDHLGGAD